MHVTSNRLAAYAVSLTVLAGALLLRVLLEPVLRGQLPFITIIPAVGFAAWHGGLGPGLATTVAGGLAAEAFLLEPFGSMVVSQRGAVIGLVLYSVTSLVIVAMFDSLRRMSDEASRQAESLRATLASIGDAVITADREGRVTRMNAVAERLTGWASADAAQRPLDDVFRAIAEGTRAPVENPALRALREGTVVGLANHTLLVAKDGSERAIDDSAAPIVNRAGHVDGAVLVFRDISEQRRSQVEQARALDTLNSLVASAPVGIALLDDEMRFRHVNATLARFNAQPAEVHLGRTLKEIVPDVAPQVEQVFRQVLDTSTAVLDHIVETHVPGRSEERRVSREGWFPIAGRNGRAAGVGVIVQDITDERRADARFQASQEASLFGFAILRAIRDGTSRIVDFEWVYMNPVGAALARRPAQDLVGRRLLELFPSNRDNSDLFERYVRVVETGIPHDYEVAYDGEGIRAWFRNMAVKLDDGVAVSFADITERRQQEDALRASEARFRQLAEAMPQIVWVADPSGRFVYLNRHWCTVTGRSLEDGLGEGWLSAVEEADLSALSAAWRESVRRVSPFTGEFRLRAADGSSRWHIAHGVPVHDDGGAVVAWYGSTTDIDEPKRLAEALRAADRRKDEFLATLTHELRNPLAPVRNALEVMRRASGDARLVEQARATMERQVAHMVRLIDDLLDVSRITQDRLTLTLDDADLGAIVQHAVETCAPLCERAGQQMVTELSPEPIRLRADAMRLAQVFGNLLNNATKYTPPGGRITLHAAREGSDVVVTVSDTGIGIDPDVLPYVFDLFTQARAVSDPPQEGLGIGLSLVKRLVEMHGGTVTAASDGAGRGSRFTVRLPALSAASAGAPRPAQTEDMMGPFIPRRVLVVDDNHDSAESLSTLLELMGHQTAVAHDGLEAVERAGSFRPDVILLDIGLPQMDGYEACRAIRQEAWGQGMVLVALTGWGQDEDRRKSREAGFDHHMVKPVDHIQLTRLIDALPRAESYS